MTLGQISLSKLFAPLKVTKPAATTNQNGNGGQQQKKQKGYVYKKPNDQHATGQMIDFYA